MKNLTKYTSLIAAWRLAAVALAFLVLSSSTNLYAQGTLAYSFEDGSQDMANFAANGTFISPLTQDTIGATDGTKSLKVELQQNAFYAGALAGNLDPNIIGDPPGVFSMTFDLTIPTQFPLESFVDIFVVFFGVGQAGEEAEVSFQGDLTNRVGVGDFAPGTYPIRMEFNEAFHPLDFENFEARSFNDIFGTQGSGPIDIIPTGFQITINKSTTAPWVGYIDNVRFSSTDGIPGDFDGDGDVDGRDFLAWQRGNSPIPFSAEDLALWQTSYPGPLTGFTTVPEPTSIMLIMMAACGLLCGRPRTA